MTARGRLWPWALGTVLAVTMAGNIWVMRLAGSDASFAVEPDYYRKAVDWDSTMAQSGRNIALGWDLDARLAPPDTDGSSRVTVALRGADGAPIHDAVITLEATHNAHASRVLEAILQATGDGTYHALLPDAQRGIWELRFEASRSGDRFTATHRRDTSRDGPGR
jgi:nitrogen fixation protein FixH